MYVLAAVCHLPLLACAGYRYFPRLGVAAEACKYGAVMFCQGATGAARGEVAEFKAFHLPALLPILTASVVVCLHQSHAEPLLRSACHLVHKCLCK